MATEQEQVLTRIVLEAFGAGDLDVVDQLVAEQVIEHQYGLPGGRDELKPAIAGLWRAFPDLSYAVIGTTFDGEKVWGHFRARGTNLGPFQGREPTGRAVEIDVIDVARVEEGRLVEHWGVPDRFALLDQLGLSEWSGAREEMGV